MSNFNSFRFALFKGEGFNADRSILLSRPSGFLRKPLNAEAGVVAKEDSIPTILVMLFGNLECISA